MAGIVVHLEMDLSRCWMALLYTVKQRIANTDSRSSRESIWMRGFMCNVDNLVAEDLFVTSHNEQWGQAPEVAVDGTDQRICQKIIGGIQLNLGFDLIIRAADADGKSIRGFYMVQI